jgi:hypothetical protein
VGDLAHEVGDAGALRDRAVRKNFMCGTWRMRSRFISS